ncbi:MAG: hypothetical protein ACODAU_09495, partial [Myxococcota bacterium]
PEAGGTGAPPAGGGFGAPPGAGAPGWGGAPAQPSGVQPATSGVNKKVLLWVGVGCAALVVLGCLATAAGMWFIGRSVDEGEKSFAAQASRVSLGFALSGIQMSCQTAGARAAADYFHPEAFAGLQDQACTVDDAVIDVFADPEKSEAEVLARTDMADKAEALGLDPESCFLYQASEARIIGCDPEDGFRIIHLENLDSL